MTYRGQVKNGQIVLEGGAELREGASVEVSVVEPSPGAFTRGTPQAILSSRARWVGPETEADTLLDQLRREKWAEVDAQQAVPDEGL